MSYVYLLFFFLLSFFNQKISIEHLLFAGVLLDAGDNKMSKAWVLRISQWRSQINEYTLSGNGEVREVQICPQFRGTPIYSLLYLSMPSRMLKTLWMNFSSGCECECVLCTGQVIQDLRKIFNGRNCIYYFCLLKVAYSSLSNCF